MLQALVAKGEAWLRQTVAVLGGARPPLKRLRDLLHAGLRLPVEMPEVEELRGVIRRLGSSSSSLSDGQMPGLVPCVCVCVRCAVQGAEGGAGRGAGCRPGVAILRCPRLPPLPRPTAPQARVGGRRPARCGRKAAEPWGIAGAPRGGGWEVGADALGVPQCCAGGKCSGVEGTCGVPATLAAHQAGP